MADGGDIVLLDPDAERLTVLLLMGLLLASKRVTVTIAVAVLSARTEVGETVTVDALAETAPGVKITVAEPVNVMLSVVLVAVMVLVSALVDLIVKIAFPAESVTTDSGKTVLFTPEADIFTVFPLTGLIKSSTRVTVTVMRSCPLATTEVWEATRVDFMLDTGPAIKVTTCFDGTITLPVVSFTVTLFASALVDLIVVMALPLASVVRDVWLIVLAVPENSRTIPLPGI